MIFKLFTAFIGARVILLGYRQNVDEWLENVTILHCGSPWRMAMGLHFGRACYFLKRLEVFFPQTTPQIQLPKYIEGHTLQFPESKCLIYTLYSEYKSK